MKEFIEEYGNVLLGIIVAVILLTFLYAGFKEEGWLRALLISNMQKTYGG